MVFGHDLFVEFEVLAVREAFDDVVGELAEELVGELEESEEVVKVRRRGGGGIVVEVRGCGGLFGVFCWFGFFHLSCHFGLESVFFALFFEEEFFVLFLFLCLEFGFFGLEFQLFLCESIGGGADWFVRDLGFGRLVVIVGGSRCGFFGWCLWFGAVKEGQFGFGWGFFRGLGFLLFFLLFFFLFFFLTLGLGLGFFLASALFGLVVFALFFFFSDLFLAVSFFFLFVLLNLLDAVGEVGDVLNVFVLGLCLKSV